MREFVTLYVAWIIDSVRVTHIIPCSKLYKRLPVENSPLLCDELHELIFT